VETEFQELLPIPKLHGIPSGSGIPGIASNSGIAWNFRNLMELSQ